MIKAQVKNTLLFCCILTIVLLVNMPVISFDMMYPEQTTIYLANQTITQARDLLNIYLHPKWLQTDISFFRPSGHFLIYQLITPFLGWHNTKAFFIINFMFLAGIGYLVIKLYPMLFPGRKMGAYIAFSIYLMHPALNLARVTVMHFEFSYVYFLMLSLYLFAKFCQNQRASFFISSMFFYMFACTFKEPALMLGPVLVGYYWLNNWRSPKQNTLIITTISAICLLLTWYFTSAWPSLKQTPRVINLHDTLGSANAFLKDIIGLTHDYIKVGGLPFPNSGWRLITFSFVSRCIMFAGCWTALITAIIIFTRKTADYINDKKSLVFLYISAILFMILPLAWGIGGPWHHSLTLLFLSIAMGFSIEYLCRFFTNKPAYINAFCLLLSLVIAANTLPMNQQNIKTFKNEKGGAFGFTLNHNAVFNPPDIKHKLNADSILVVEDSTLHNDYFLGNSAYPFILFLTSSDYDIIQKHQSLFYLRFDHTYSGTLFRYAYEMPNLHEVLYPFQVEKMEDVFNEMIYSWLRHINNIFCVGYDQQGNWHDKTALFKQQLLKIQAERQINVKEYRFTTIRAKVKPIYFTRSLAIPNIELCQFTCDQDSQCKGFIYSERTCQFYRSN